MDQGYGSSNSLRKWFNHDDILKKKIREMESVTAAVLNGYLLKKLEA